MSNIIEERKALIRKAIEEAKPAEEYFAEQEQLRKAEQKVSETMDHADANKRDLSTAFQDANIKLSSLEEGTLTKQELRGISAVITYVAHYTKSL